MLNEYKEVYQGSIGEIVEKKSRFIATIQPIKTEENALEFIEKTKKKYLNATHNCFAYTIGMKHELTRCSDDGEPSGTAGKPMLDILLGEDLHNVAVVVTRYFGGTLLGTGGLIRAYQSAVKEGLLHAIVALKNLGSRLQITTNYNEIGKLQYTAAQLGLWIEDTIYTDVVNVSLLVPFDKLSEFTKKWTTITNGNDHINNLGNVYFAKIDSQIIVFEE